MYLEKITIRNFRSFDAEIIPLARDLTIFVGENNGGKSNAIDAIRLITTPLSGRREIYCEENDIRFGSLCRRFEIEARFAELSVPQQGRLLSAAADHSLESAIFGLCYDESTGAFPVRPTLWAGHLKGTPEAGCHDKIRHVYLPPLRDAKYALASGNPTRIYALLKFFLGSGDPNELAKRLRRDDSEPILATVGGAVDVGLTALTAGVRQQVTSLGFANDEKLIDIARDLRFKLSDHGIEPEDLRYSGHGYANILYMATIAVELESVNNADLTIFLVEEPEAHLHPQLQAAVLCFLEEQAEKSRKSKPDYQGPAGELQVVVATHSPNLSAWVENKKIVFFRSIEKAQEMVSFSPESPADMAAEPPSTVPNSEIPTPVPAADPGTSIEPTLEPQAQAFDGAQSDLKMVAIESVIPALDTSSTVLATAAQHHRRSTRCIPLSSLNLSDEARRKIDRYLDVTKSGFLFGGRVLLVEGIAEALLLPIIAKKFVLKGSPEKLRIFRCAVFVPIDGVDFEPYVQLLLTPHSGVRIADRVVVVTDGDRADLDQDKASPGQLRKTVLDEIATKSAASGVFDAIINTYSLETELVRAGNASLLKTVYLKLHPKSETNWDNAVAKGGAEQAVAIQALFKKTPKGDFAQILADKISEGASFVVPDYLEQAIVALTK